MVSEILFSWIISLHFWRQADLYTKTFQVARRCWTFWNYGKNSRYSPSSLNCAIYTFILNHRFSKLLVCMFITSPVREGSTFLVIWGVQLFQTELKLVRRVSVDANLKRFQHNWLLSEQKINAKGLWRWKYYVEDCVQKYANVWKFFSWKEKHIWRFRAPQKGLSAVKYGEWLLKCITLDCR